jgi:hypothetical protein
MTTLLRAAWDRMRTNMRDPLIRRNVGFFMGGKLLGLALVLGLMYLVLPGAAHAALRGTPVDMPTINAVNTVRTPLLCCPLSENSHTPSSKPAFLASPLEVVHSPV